jgi:3-oxoacyl-[acyl-carrier protein] reductase
MRQDLLDGRTAVITGAARGIGFAIAERFVQEGARVVIGDIDETAALDAARSLGGPKSAVGLACDVTVSEDMARLVAAAADSFTPVDVFVNNAGFLRDASMRNMTESDFDEVIAVHLKGAWNGVRHASAVMRERKSGSIINMSSISGKVGNPGQTNYSAAKAGMVGLTKASALEMARHGVRVNAIQPGLIRSAMTEALPQKLWDEKVALIPLGRVGEVSEVASVALFLASDLSSFMTGTVLEVTGGRYM